MFKGIMNVFKKEKQKQQAVSDIIEYGNKYFEEHPTYKDTDEMLEALEIDAGEKKSVLEKSIESLDRAMNVTYCDVFSKEDTLVVISKETEIAEEFIEQVKDKTNCIHNIRGKGLATAIEDYIEYCGNPRLILVDCKFMDYRSMLNSKFKSRVELIRLD